MRLHAVRHVPYEGLGHIEPWARSRGFEIVETRPFDGDELPDPAGADWHVVLGGPMGACDESEHPWLAEEKAWLARLIEARVPLLAICLGAQLTAEVLGARVHRHDHPEIGWHTVTPTEAGAGSALAPFFAPGERVIQWHYDTFEIPDGALHLARSEGCESQAFSWGDRVCAVQFHPEVTRDEVSAILARDAPLPAGEWIDAPERLLEVSRFDRAARTTAEFLDRLRESWS